jgi:hypothetical protein
MKRKVKKFAEGGTNVRTRTDEEFAEDSKFGGYGKYMPKTKSYSMDDVKSGLGRLLGGKSSPSEDRPTSSGVEDYASMGKRSGAMPAKSTWSGTPDIKEETKTETETVSEPDSVAGKSARNLALEDAEEVNPVKRKSTIIKKADKTISPISKKESGQSNRQKLGATYSAMYSRLQDASVPEGPGKDALRKAVDKAKKDYESAPMKKGGAVKKMASGGKTSSASSRGDGIAQRGKTKGRMC